MRTFGQIIQHSPFPVGYVRRHNEGGVLPHVLGLMIKELGRWFDLAITKRFAVQHGYRYLPTLDVLFQQNGSTATLCSLDRRGEIGVRPHNRYSERRSLARRLYDQRKSELRDVNRLTVALPLG